ncbi:MAG: AAA family ATPase [Clostridia bacterium]|nr:AAA family ATPase [Clostridia bacterium]
MKLLSCNIAGFGKFVNAAFDLSSPITCVKGDNGWGKTTLADFIGSMLYGLDGGRTRSVSGNDRLRYEPWSGARFGGSLTFLYAGRTYRVERFFGRTAGGDTVRVYDKNNMLCYDFGDKCERLGETLFGVDRESFERTAYIPQGGQGAGAIPEDIRAKLLALLSADGDKEGASDAVARLDAAERALRAKRRPAKGRLDELDDRLAYLQAQKTDCRRAAERAEELQRQTAEHARRLAYLKAEIRKLSALAEEYARKSELAATRAAQNEIRTKFKEAQARLAELDGFFGAADPATVNTTGLETAIKEFYALKEELANLAPQAEEAARATKEKRALEAQLAQCERTLQSYELMRGETRKAAQETKENKKEERKKRRKHGNAGFGLLLSLLLALFGATQTKSIPALGITLLVVGGLGLLCCGVTLLRTSGSSTTRKTSDFADETVRGNYLAALAETEDLRKKLAAYPLESDERAEAFKKSLESKRARADALETAIKNFLSNFRFAEAYDYRASLAKIKENAEAYVRLKAVCGESERKLSAFALPAGAENETVQITSADVNEIHSRKNALEREREETTATLAGVLAQAETQEKRAGQLADIEAEEERLGEEKARLERRLSAIRTARELLVRARHNLAARYLEPVEKKVAEYAETLGFSLHARPKFSADGTPVLEEEACLRNTEYYSTGLKDLLWFCVRLALVETLYAVDPPPLILDDPFVNLDDKTTERAKSLVKALSGKYQIVYFTCKEERKL